MNIKLISEYLTIDRLISEVYPEGIVSLVSDSFDFWSVITKVAPALKDKIMARNGKTVFRPDSGDPVKILTGYKVFKELGLEKYNTTSLLNAGYEAIQLWDTGDIYLLDEFGMFQDTITEAEAKGAVQCLYETFGGTITDKGYKLLDSHVGLIYGDSITLERAEQILSRLEAKGFASGNVVFGIGSFTYEYQTRDTFGFAMKATAGKVNGEMREIFKDPATDKGTKRSAKGLLRVEKEGDNFVLYDQQTEEQAEGGALEVVFKDGKLVRKQSLANIRRILGTFA